MASHETIIKLQAEKLGGGWRIEQGIMPVVVLTTVEAEKIIEKLEKLEAGLVEISTRSPTERNPDGEEQAAYTMQLIAKEALNDQGGQN